MAADFSNMMEKQLWKVTTYWARKELDEMGPLLQRLPGAKAKLCQAIMKWMFAHVIGKQAVFFPKADEALTLDAFRTSVCATLKIDPNMHQPAWAAVWATLSERVLQHLLVTLLPFERANARGGIVVRLQQHAEDRTIQTIRKMSSSNRCNSWKKKTMATRMRKTNHQPPNLAKLRVIESPAGASNGWRLCRSASFSWKLPLNFVFAANNHKRPEPYHHASRCFICSLWRAMCLATSCGRSSF